MYGIARRAAPDRMGGAVAAGLRRLRARCASATPPTASCSSTCSARSWTRCTRRAAAGSPRANPAGPCSMAFLAHLERIWTEPDEGHLGGARRAPALHLFQGDGLGRLRSRDQERRGIRPRRPARPLARARAPPFTPTSAGAASIPQPDSFVQSYDRQAARCQPAAAAAWSASCRRTIRACAARSQAIERRLMVDGFVLRYDTAAADDGLPPGEGAVPGLQLLAGRRLCDARIAGTTRARCSTGCWRCATTSACSARNTTRAAAELRRQFPAGVLPSSRWSTARST